MESKKGRWKVRNRSQDYTFVTLFYFILGKNQSIFMKCIRKNIFQTMLQYGKLQYHLIYFPKKSVIYIFYYKEILTLKN